jgi:hypothetical protein
MNIRNKFYLLVCVALCVLFTQAVWAQTPVTIKFYGTDGSGITDSLTLAVHPDGTNGAVADSISPTLKESSEGLPPEPKGVDLRVIPYPGYDGKSNYTSIHDLVYDTQLELWKVQFQRDSAQTAMDFYWQAGLAGVGAGYWKIVGDPNETDGAIASLDVDMTSTTMLHVLIPDTDPHTFFIKKGDGGKLRTFTPDEIADAADSKGKKGKSEKRKAYQSEWCLQFTNATGGDANDIHIEFSQAVVQVLSSQGWTGAVLGSKKQDFTAPAGDTVHNNGTWTVCGIGDKGKAIAVSKWYWTMNGEMVGTKNKGATQISGRLRYKMPNLNNIGEECYAQNVWTETFNTKPAGIVLGTQLQAGVHDSVKLKPIYKFVYHPKWKDALKTLSDKGVKHGGPAGCLLNFQSAKPIEKGQKALPPGKLSNVLVSEALALAFNIGASDAAKMELDGLGEMIYVNQPGDPAGLPAGSTVRQIDAMMDSVLSCISSRAGTFAEWDSVCHRINSAASAAFDTTVYDGPVGTKTLGTQAAGVKAVADVGFLYRTSLVAVPVNHVTPLDLSTLDAKPKQYQLEQNYPNPFNPTTTIQFSLPEDAFVTMKIYNMLGQEVATLAENEEFTEGFNDVTFDASNFASGVYFYRIVAHGIDDGGNVKSNSFTSVKKMMLVK